VFKYRIADEQRARLNLTVRESISEYLRLFSAPFGLLMVVVVVSKSDHHCLFFAKELSGFI